MHIHCVCRQLLPTDSATPLHDKLETLTYPYQLCTLHQHRAITDGPVSPSLRQNTSTVASHSHLRLFIRVADLPLQLRLLPNPVFATLRLQCTFALCRGVGEELAPCKRLPNRIVRSRFLVGQRSFVLRASQSRHKQHNLHNSLHMDPNGFLSTGVVRGSLKEPSVVDKPSSVTRNPRCFGSHVVEGCTAGIVCASLTFYRQLYCLLTLMRFLRCKHCHIYVCFDSAGNKCALAHSLSLSSRSRSLLLTITWHRTRETTRDQASNRTPTSASATVCCLHRAQWTLWHGMPCRSWFV